MSPQSLASTQFCAVSQGIPNFRLLMTECLSELVRASLLSFLRRLRAWHQHSFVLYLRAFRGFHLKLTEFPSELVRAFLLSFLLASGEECPFCTSELVLGRDPCPLKAWHQHSFEL